jgi:hypothetical protein
MTRGVKHVLFLISQETDEEMEEMDWFREFFLGNFWKLRVLGLFWSLTIFHWFLVTSIFNGKQTADSFLKRQNIYSLKISFKSDEVLTKNWPISQIPALKATHLIQIVEFIHQFCFLLNDQFPG